MDPKEVYGKRKRATGDDAECVIQEAIINALRIKEWLVRPITASAMVYGWPDLYAAHATFGQRWIEVKCPTDYSFTPAQRKFFPQLQAARVGIWILTSSDDLEIRKLMQPPNWYTYLAAYPAIGMPNLSSRPTHTRKLRQ